MAPRGIVIRIEGDGESARKALEMVREQLAATADESKESSSEIAENMERVKSALETVGLYMGVREAIAGLKELTVGSMELGEQLLKASQRTGLTVESLSVLHYAAQVTGGDFDGLVNGLGRMSRTIGQAADGNKQASTFIKALGLDAKDLAGRTDGAEVAFHRFVTVLGQTESPIRRNELAMGLLGKAGSAQIPMLLEIAEHWDEFKSRAEAAGVVLTGDTAKALADTSQRMKDLEQHIEGAGLALTEGMAPGLTQIFSIISGGKSQMEAMQSWGRDLSKTIAFIGEVAYSAAAALEGMFSIAEGGRLTQAGRTDQAAALELKQKAQGMHDIAFGNSSAAISPLISGAGGGGAGSGFDGAPAAAKAKSDDSIARAAAALAEEQSKSAADKQKESDQTALAELEAQHKMGLVADQEFYAEKLRLQNDALDAEAEALRSKQATLQQLYDKQHADKNAKRDKSGNSAEELRTQKEMLQVQEQLDALETKRAANSSAATAETSGSNKASDIASLRLAAELEKQRNDGITAQIALIRQEKELEAQKVTNEGGSSADAANVRALGEVEVKKLQIEQLTKQITDAEDDNKRAVEALNDAAAKDPRLKKEAADAINKLNAQEAAQLKVLVAEYTALASELGGDFLKKAKDLQAELDKLNRPSQKSDAQFSKTLGEGMTSMAERMADATISGKDSFHKMAMSIEKDLADLLIKLAAQKWLFPALAGMGSGGGSSSVPTAGPDIEASLFDQHADGTDNAGGGPQIIGEKGPEVWQPPLRGGSIISNKDLATQLTGGGGGGSRGISVQSNIINQSSQPVTAQAPKVSYNSEMKSFIIHTILEDHAQGGPTSAIGAGS